jgi:hypothetical protein
MGVTDFDKSYGAEPAANIVPSPKMKSRRQIVVIGTLLAHVPRRHGEH